MRYLRTFRHVLLTTGLVLALFMLFTEASHAWTTSPDEDKAAAVEGQMSEAADETPPTLFENLGTLAMLILLQAVPGFDNMLYISLESKTVSYTHLTMPTKA